MDLLKKVRMPASQSSKVLTLYVCLQYFASFLYLVIAIYTGNVLGVHSTSSHAISLFQCLNKYRFTSTPLFPI